VRDCGYLRSVASSPVVGILVYDHLLTLGAEVKYIWSSKLRPSTWWFFAVRYIGLGANIVLSVYNFGEFDHEVRVGISVSAAPILSLMTDSSVIEGVRGAHSHSWRLLHHSQLIIFTDASKCNGYGMRCS
jgi:hypothetical protein